MFEEIVNRRMCDFLMRFSILSDSQHGFRTSRSAQTACSEFVEFVNRFLDAPHNVMGIFFDFSEAFVCNINSLSISFIKWDSVGYFLNWYGVTYRIVIYLSFMATVFQENITISLVSLRDRYWAHFCFFMY